ncbi:MAG: efflux RND transporter permease subunit [Pirellulaceae bacterium]
MQLTITFEKGTDLEQKLRCWCKTAWRWRNRIAARGPASWRYDSEKFARHLDGRAFILARQLSRLALYQQLCAAQHQRRSVRQNGVGNVQIFGVREYNMRIWIDPDRLSTLGMTTNDIVDALRSAKTCSCRRSIGTPPSNDAQGAFQLNIATQGRLESVEEFKQIVVKRGSGTGLVRLQDVARVELVGLLHQQCSGWPKEAVGIAVFQRPGSNAVATSREHSKLDGRSQPDVPTGDRTRGGLQPNQFVSQSIDEVIKALFGRRH